MPDNVPKEGEEIMRAMRAARLPMRARKAIYKSVCGAPRSWYQIDPTELTRENLARITFQTLISQRNCGTISARQAMAWIDCYLGRHPRKSRLDGMVWVEMVNRKMAIACDTKKRFIHIKDTDQWHWHHSGDPETLSNSFPTFLDALDEAVQPYWPEEQDPEDDLPQPNPEKNAP
jgi:hypothetical protein